MKLFEMQTVLMYSVRGGVLDLTVCLYVFLGGTAEESRRPGGGAVWDAS